MRLIIPIAALLIAALSVSLDLLPASPASPVCLHGGCRFDQMYPAIDAAGATPEAVATLVAADPANPMVWCTYAEALSRRGDHAKARSAFERAIALGPGMPAVLMRAANFDFTQSQNPELQLLSSRILTQTEAFDEILFSYLQRPETPVASLLGSAIPAEVRPARSWLAWLRDHGSDQDLLDTWKWMRQNALLDESSASGTAWTLWNRKSYAPAHALWANWTGANQLLSNPRFDAAPRETPFDWSIGSSPAVAITRANGLNVRFLGNDNIAYSGIRQLTVLPAGRYRFAAEVSADNLTTDQGPFFRIFGSKLNAETAPILGAVGKSWITVDFTVAPGSEPVAIEIERHASERFDNRISGTLHIFQVSLAPL